MRPKLVFVVPLVLVLEAATALATPAIARSPEPQEPKDRSMEAAIGMLLGGAEVGDVDGTGVGVLISLGKRFGEWTFSGELNYIGIDHKNDVEPPGNSTRLALTSRYNAFQFGGGKTPIMGTLWLEGGLGVQRVAWDAGGVLTRPDVALGFGFSWAGILNNDQPKQKKTIGWYVSFRMQFAQAPASTMTPPPTCAGPCDRPTSPSRNDVSMFANFGLHWGRY